MPFYFEAIHAQMAMAFKPLQLRRRQFFPNTSSEAKKFQGGGPIFQIISTSAFQAVKRKMKKNHFSGFVI